MYRSASSAVLIHSRTAPAPTSEPVGSTHRSRRAGILLGVTIVWRRGWTPDPGVPVGDTLEHIVRRFGVVANLLGGAWPVTILVAATPVLSLPAQLAVAPVLATWLVFRAAGRRLARAA